MQGVRFDRPLVVLRRPHRRKQPVTANGFGVDIAVDEILFKLLPAGQPRAGVVEDHAHAVKDQLVLTADQVVVAEDDAVVAGPRGQHLCPFAPLPGVVRGAVDVDNHERPGGRLRLARAAWGPDILADRDADRDAFNDKHRRAASGVEVSLFVKYPVVRQALLVVDAHPVRSDAHRRRVVEVRALIDESHDRGDALGAAGDFLQRGQVSPHKVGFEQEIFRGITGDRQFGEADDIRAQIARAVDGLANTAGIALQVSHRRIDLGQADAQHPDSSNQLYSSRAVAESRSRGTASGSLRQGYRPPQSISQRVRFAELGRVAVDRAAPEALRNERYLTPTSNSRFPLANTFLPCNGERGQFGTFVPLLWTMGIRGTIHRNAGWRDGGNAAHSRRTLLPSPDAGSLVTGPVIIRRQDFLRDFFHRLAGAACLTLDLSKCGSFVQPTPAHQDPFGALNQFAGSQRILEAPDVFMQRTDFAKPRQGDFNRRAEVALPHRFDQVGEDAGFLGPVHELTVGVRG